MQSKRKCAPTASADQPERIGHRIGMCILCVHKTAMRLTLAMPLDPVLRTLQYEV